MNWMLASIDSTRVFARQRLALFAAKHMPLSVQRGQHASRSPVQFVIELLLQSAQPVIVSADIAQHLRGNVDYLGKSA